MLLATPEYATSDPHAASWEWLRIQTRRRSDLMGLRREIQRILRFASDWGATHLWDLNLDKTIWGLPRPDLGLIHERAHVLHHLSQYRVEGRSAAGRARTTYLRRRLKQLTTPEATIVVHRPGAIEVIQPLLNTGRAVNLPYPVTSSSNPLPRRQAPRRPQRGTKILFLGAGRQHKGLHILIEALPAISRPVVLEILGRQPTAVREMLSGLSNPAIRVRDEYVNDDVVASYLRRTDLVVAPYLKEFKLDEAASGVLLDSLKFGVATVVTNAISDQLPPHYGGAVIVPESDARALADGIDRAIEKLPTVAARAAREGPEYIRRHHVYEAYVKGLLS